MAGLAHLVVAIVAVVTLLPTWGYGLPNPEKLWNDYRTFPVRPMQEAFLKALARDWPYNRRAVTFWQWATRVAVVFVAAEAIALGVSLVLSRVNT
jgi:hypothetical protein